MSTDGRIAWCGRAILALTILARGTYLAGTDDVVDPPRLRRFNELTHRIAGRQAAIDMDEATIESFFALVGASTDELGVSAALLEQLRSCAGG
ncbi:MULTISPECIES: hypothetical protein [Methylosinus]|nr:MULTISPECIES: hypothetical protein [Methylosinus]